MSVRPVPRARRPRSRPRLGLEEIVDAALALVDAEGTEAVTMRRVAAAFDTGPASLYAYVADKDELLRHVLDRIIAEMPAPEGETWQELVRDFAHRNREVFRRHQDAARLSFAHIPSGQNMLAGTERLIGAMIEGGVPDQVAAWALDILALYVAADAFEHWLWARTVADDSGRDPAQLGEEYVAGVQTKISSMLGADYPYLTRLLPVMMAGGSDERFAFGIDMLIAGFAAQVNVDQVDASHQVDRATPSKERA